MVSLFKAIAGMPTAITPIDPKESLKADLPIEKNLNNEEQFIMGPKKIVVDIKLSSNQVQFHNISKRQIMDNNQKQLEVNSIAALKEMESIIKKSEDKQEELASKEVIDFYLLDANKHLKMDNRSNTKASLQRPYRLENLDEFDTVS